MEMTKDNSKECLVCNSKSEYRIDFIYEELLVEKLYICEEHRKELIDMLLPF